jgi:hypothetical protein
MRVLVRTAEQDDQAKLQSRLDFAADEPWQRSVVFVRDPKEEPYDTVAVFLNLYGSLRDLLQPTQSDSRLRRR